MKAGGIFNIIVFSKDRACQLDLFLRSFNKYFTTSSKINVLYTYSSDLFKQGYDKLIESNPSVNFIPESNFRNQTIDLVKRTIPYTVFFVDDIVFIDYFTFDSAEWAEFEDNDKVLALSLRLGENINYCYPSNTYCPSPVLNKNGVYNWNEYRGYWSYPMSVDGNIYKTKDLHIIMENIKFEDPNTLEYQLACNPIKKPNMISFKSSKLINLAINRVQNNFLNRSGGTSHHLMNDDFIKGKVIDLETIVDCNLKKQNSCHIEIELSWAF